MNTTSGRKEALRLMLLIREFDTSVGDLFSDGEIPGFVHLYVGQEAVGVGACAALGEDDYLTSTHRGHGHCIAKGLDPELMMAELYGRRDGYCNGKGGSMHIADVDSGMLGANGIVGGGPPIAAGAALASTLSGDDQVTLAFYGDGGASQGQVHESLNLAAVWDLPVIFLIENNQYGEALPVEKQYNIDRLSDMAASYGIPGVTVDGMSVTDVYEMVSDARERAAAGDGPTLIEAETYRYDGHYVGDPEPYRSEDEVARWRERDPIEQFASKLERSGEVTEEERESLATEVQSTIAEAIEFARDSPDPELADAYTDVFAEPVPEIERFKERNAVVGSPKGENR